MLIDNNNINININGSENLYQDRIYRGQISSLENMNNKEKELNRPDMTDYQNEKLKLLAEEFTSILLKQMFKSMRNTVFRSELLEGGFAEEVFTDMMDEEISKK